MLAAFLGLCFFLLCSGIFLIGVACAKDAFSGTLIRKVDVTTHHDSKRRYLGGTH